MALIQIPIDTSQPDHQFSIELDGRVYLLRFKKLLRSSLTRDYLIGSIKR